MVRIEWNRREETRERLLAELERLLGRLRRLRDVEEVWLFGSAAEGTVHLSSDLDLLVVRRTDEAPVRRGITLHRELVPTVPVDLFVYTPAEWRVGGRFARDVRRRGRRLL